MNRPFSLADILAPKAVMDGVEALDKKQLLHMIAEHAAELLSLESHVLTDILWAREKLGTTGVGHGIAIPHGRVPGLTSVRGFFARLKTPVSFDSVDGQPVDLVFMLVAPEEAGADHLHALATISRALREPVLCEGIRKAKDSASIYKILSTAQSSEAA